MQETWLRLSRTDSATIENLGAWLTTVVSRVCLNVLRARGAHREVLVDQIPDPVVAAVDALLDRTPEAARQLASRARRRVRGGTARTDADRGRRQEIVDAFLAAAREGDFGGLLALLDPDVVRRADLGPGVVHITRGAEQVAAQARRFGHDMDLDVRRALVNGAPGGVAFRDGRPFSVSGLDSQCASQFCRLAPVAQRSSAGHAVRGPPVVVRRGSERRTQPRHD